MSNGKLSEFVDSNGNTIIMSDGSSATGITLDPGGRILMNSQIAQQSNPYYKDIQQWIDSTKKRIEETKRATSILEKTLANLKSFPFKEGDVIVSKQFGTGIISGGDVIVSKQFGTGIISGMGIGDGTSSSFVEEFPNSFYVVVSTKDGFRKVSPEDILPYTRAAKVLHERS